MRILWVATKAPWPTNDGGRLVQWLTLESLRDQGVDVTLVAPIRRGGSADCRSRLSEVCTPSLVERMWVETEEGWRPPGWLSKPLSIARHFQPPVRRRVEALVAKERFDLVHVEQLQALPQAWPASAEMPLVLRAQNVESDLWRRAARSLRIGRPLALLEARRLARWEGAAIRRVSTAVALTWADACRLRELAGETGRVEHVSPPFKPVLPIGGATLPGSPAIVLFGNHSWYPNREGESWFRKEVWPEVAKRLPGCILHTFGGSSENRPGIQAHPAPEDSGEAFAPGSIMVVPLRIASGVRMKILEAWARGVPVVATPEAAAGLEVESGRQLFIADDAESFARACVRLASETGGVQRIVEEGRRYLVAHHLPEHAGERLVEVYRRALELW